MKPQTTQEAFERLNEATAHLKTLVRRKLRRFTRRELLRWAFFWGIVYASLGWPVSVWTFPHWWSKSMQVLFLKGYFAK